MDNDLAPNDSETLGVYDDELTAEDQQAERSERSKMAAATPLIEELLEWFEEQMAVCDSVKQVTETSRAQGLPFDETLIAHGIVFDLLKTKRSSLAARFSNYEATDES